VDDTLLVGLLEGLRDLLRDRHGLRRGDRSALHALRELFAFDELHGQEVAGRSITQGGGLEPVDVRDVGMVQRGQQVRLAREAGQALGIASQLRRQHLYRYLPAKARVRRPIDLAHAPRADGGGDAVLGHDVAGRQGQGGTQFTAAPDGVQVQSSSALVLGRLCVESK